MRHCYPLLQVHADDCSMSVNVFSESDEERAVFTLHSLALPFDEHWPPATLAHAAAVFLRMCIANVVQNVRDFECCPVQSVLQTRYSTLQMSSVANKSTLCGALHEEDALERVVRLKAIHVARITRICLIQCPPPPVVVSLIQLPRMRSTCDQVVRVLRSLRSSGVQHTVFHNYLELMASSFSSVANAAAFLEQCVEPRGDRTII